MHSHASLCGTSPAPHCTHRKVICFVAWPPHHTSVFHRGGARLRIYVIPTRSPRCCVVLPQLSKINISSVIMLYSLLRSKFALRGEVGSRSLCQHLACCRPLFVSPTIAACLGISASMNPSVPTQLAVHFRPYLLTYKYLDLGGLK